jgi:hypothetical protein
VEAAIDWEQDLLAAQRPYVERQLRAGVAGAIVVRDLVGMGADAKRAAFFVDTTAKKLAAGRALSLVVAGPRRLVAYLAWAVLAGVLSALAGALLVLGLGLAVTPASVRLGVPSFWTVGRIESASLLPGLLVGVVLRRQLSPTLHWRPVIAGLTAFAAILGVRLCTLVEILHEAPGGAGRLDLLRSGHLLASFATAPTNVYGSFTSAGASWLVLADVGFVGLAAFVSAVFSRHPAES